MGLLEIDARRPEQSLVASLEALPGDEGVFTPGAVYADGLQLEQTCV